MATNNAPSAKMLIREVAAHDTLSCVFLTLPVSRPTDDSAGPPTKVGKRAVPVWPQYTQAGFPGEVWITVGPKEQWYNDIVKAMSAEKHRVHVTETFTALLRESVLAARGGRVCGDDGKSGKLVRRAPFKTERTLDITIQGHALSAANSLRPFMLKAESRTYEFLGGPFCAFVRRALLSAESKDDRLPADAASVTPAQEGFSFGKALCPNVRDKVSWFPTDSVWKLQIRKPKAVLKKYEDEQGRSLRVSLGLCDIEYQQAQSDAYIRAVDTWNSVDGTKRDRIRVRPDTNMSARWSSDSCL